MKVASCIAFVALLVALPAAAQLHRCKDKAGKTTYQDQPCEGTAAGKAAPAPAAGASGAAPPSDYAALSLWEQTLVLHQPKPLSPQELELAGMYGFSLGRPMNTVVCEESPVRSLIIDDHCAVQIAVRGGVCRKEESRGHGTDSVMVITGDFRSRFHVEQTLTTRNLEGTTMNRVTFDYRYLGACKPGMQRHSLLWVNSKGEWVTEAQMVKEVEGVARAADQRLNK